MNSILYKRQDGVLEKEQIQNFYGDLINSSSSSLDSSNLDQNDENYWINYYNMQQNKEEKLRIYSNDVDIVNINKQTQNYIPNSKRKLIFSRPYKGRSPSLKLKCMNDAQKSLELEETKQSDFYNDQIEEMNQLLKPKQNNEQLMIQNTIERIIKHPLYSRSSQNIRLTYPKVEQTVNQKHDKISQEQQSFQEFDDAQIQMKPIQRKKQFVHKQRQSVQLNRKTDSSNLCRSGNLLSNSHNNSYQQNQFIYNQHQKESYCEINTRKNSNQYEETKQSNMNNNETNQELQGFHMNRFLSFGERHSSMELQKNIFSNYQHQTQIQTINQQDQQKQQYQSLQQQTQQLIQPYQQLTTNINETQQNQNIKNNDQLSQNMLDKTILKFQQQKMLSTLKYQSFMLDMYQNPQQNIDAQKEYQNKQRTPSNDIINNQGYNTPNMRYEQSPEEHQSISNNLQQIKSREEVRDNINKYQQIEDQIQQSLFISQNSKEVNNNQYQKQSQKFIQKNRQLSQTAFFRELNQCRISSGCTTPATTSGLYTDKSQQSGRYSMKRLTSANLQSRQLQANTMKGEAHAPSFTEAFKVYSEEQSTLYTNQNSQNRDIVSRMNTDGKSQISNIVEGLQQLNSKQISDSYVNPIQQNKSQFVGKYFKKQIVQAPNALTKFQTLYKIFNKNNEIQDQRKLNVQLIRQQ